MPAVTVNVADVDPAGTVTLAGITGRRGVGTGVATPTLRPIPVEELTVAAVTVNVADVDPAGTVTLAGTLAAVVLELESATTTPPVPPLP